MKKEDLFEAMGQIDEKHTEEAREAVPASSAWRKWAAAAACFAFVFAGAAAYRTWTVPTAENNTNTTATTEETVSTENSIAYGMKLEGENIIYFPISFEERIRYGLVPPDAVGLTKENDYQITEADLGEVMGEIDTCGDEELIGCTVYHFAKFPELDSICIVDLGERYAFYTADGIDLGLKEGHSADAVLAGYDLPDSVTKMELQNGSWETLRIIEDREVIEAFCAVLVGKTDMGLQAHNQRLADVWKETYGNEDVYCDGETMHYGSDPAEYDRLSDQAHALWGEGEMVVWLETECGFRFYFLFVPSTNAISGFGYYPLSPEETDGLVRLLAIDQ